MSLSKETVLTEEGLKNLEEELVYLKTQKRQEIAEKIKVALSFGDLSENAEYDEAKNEQGILEARIAEIEATLKNVRVVDADELNTEHISVGNKIELETPDGKIMKFSLVGSKEVDLSQMKLSDESPIGKACIGKRIGDMVEVEAPSGIKTYKVIKIDK